MFWAIQKQNIQNFPGLCPLDYTGKGLQHPLQPAAYWFFSSRCLSKNCPPPPPKKKTIAGYDTDILPGLQIKFAPSVIFTLTKDYLLES